MGQVANAKATDLLGHGHASLILLSRFHLSILGLVGRFKKNKSKSRAIQPPAGIRGWVAEVRGPWPLRPCVPWASASSCAVRGYRTETWSEGTRVGVEEGSDAKCLLSPRRVRPHHSVFSQQPTSPAVTFCLSDSQSIFYPVTQMIFLR